MSLNRALNHQNNYVKNLNMVDNATKNFDILQACASFIIIFKVKQSYFQSALFIKFLDTSAKPFFPITVDNYSIDTCRLQQRK